MKKNISNIIIAIELVVILVLPLALFNWKEGQVSKAENRNLAEKPVIFMDDGKLSETLVEDFNNWFGDNLGLRDFFLNISSFVNYNVFHKSTTEKVQLGKDGWLYFTLHNNLDLVNGNYPNFEEEDLAKYLAVQVGIKEKLAEQGIEYVLVIPPSKVSIYPEYIDEDNYELGETAADIFANYVEANSDIKVVRLKDALLDEKAKSDELLFYKTDTHWSSKGRYIGYKKIIDDFIEWDLLDEDKFEVKYTEDKPHVGDLSRMMGPVTLTGKNLSEPCVDWEDVNPQAKKVKKGDFYTEVKRIALEAGVPGSHVYIYHNDTIEDKKILIYGDSMIGSCILPALAENYTDLVFIWTYDIKQDMIDAVKPDVLMMDVAERGLQEKLIERLDYEFLKTSISFDDESKLMDVYYMDNTDCDEMYANVWADELGRESTMTYQAEKTQDGKWHIIVDVKEFCKSGLYKIEFSKEPKGDSLHKVLYDIGNVDF